MMHGRRTRNLELGAGAAGTDLAGACFLRDGDGDGQASAVCAVALPSSATASVPLALSFDPARYGLAAASPVLLTDLESGTQLGRFAAGAKVEYSVAIPSFGVVLLKLASAAPGDAVRAESELLDQAPKRGNELGRPASSRKHVK